MYSVCVIIYANKDDDDDDYYYYSLRQLLTLPKHNSVVKCLYI